MAQGMKHILLRAFARAAVFATAGAALSSAWAQSAATGQTLYNKVFVSGVQSCMGCHFSPSTGPDKHILIKGVEAARIKGATLTQAQMRPFDGKITDAEYNHIAAYLAQTYGVTATYISTSAAPSPTVSATSLTFASQRVGTTGTAQTVTVTNAASATAALALSAIGTGSDFVVTGGTCSVGMAIAIGGSCTVSVAFKPVAAGARAGTLTLAHNGPDGKAEVALSGTAIDTAPVASISPATLSFSGVVGVDSNAMRTTLSNTGNAPLALSALAIGGSHASDFRLASTSTCTAGSSIAGGSSCVADLVFKPAATGARVATLTFSHNAAGGTSAVTLSGTATLTPQPGLAIDATDLDVGSQPVATTGTPRTLTVTNTGGAALVLSNLTVTGTDVDDFVRGGTCTPGGSVASRATCTITLALKPATLGLKTATLTISSNAPDAAVTTVALRGTAVRTPAPLVSLSQASLGFGTVTIGTVSVPRNVVLTNDGTAPMAVTSIASSSAEYPATHDCPATLAVGTSCLITVSFKPAAAVSAEALVITTDALSSPNSIVVTGEGTTQALSVVAWQGTATTLNFASTVAGETAASQTLTLENKGPGAVSITTLGLAGAAASSYAIASTSTCKLGQSLAVNGTCTVTLNFVPASAGKLVATLQVATTGTVPGDITLSGTGAAKPTPAGQIGVSAATLDFTGTSVAVGSTSAAQVVTVRNSGTGAAALTGIQVTGPFAIKPGASGACPTGASSLAAGASCQVSVVFSPVANGTVDGRLTIGGMAPVTVDLKGLSLVPNGGMLTAGSTLIDFRDAPTPLGQKSAEKTVTLSNGPVATVTVTKAETTGPFAIAGNTCTTPVAVNGRCTIGVTFSPTAAGAATGVLSVTTGAGQVLAINLAGTTMANGTPGTPGTPGDPGTPGNSTVFRADIAMHPFTGALGAPSAPKTTLFTNHGTAALVIEDINTSAPFEAVAGGAEACRTTQSLAAGASCTVDVVFRAPMSTGTSTGRLTVSAKAAGATTAEASSVALQGTAVTTNAGGRSDDAQSGGGAADRLFLLLAALPLLAGARRRFSRFH